MTDELGPIALRAGTTLQVPSGDGNATGLHTGALAFCPPLGFFESSSDSDAAAGSDRRRSDCQTTERFGSDSAAPTPR